MGELEEDAKKGTWSSAEKTTTCHCYLAADPIGSVRHRPRCRREVRQMRPPPPLGSSLYVGQEFSGTALFVVRAADLRPTLSNGQVLALLTVGRSKSSPAATRSYTVD